MVIVCVFLFVFFFARNTNHVFKTTTQSIPVLNQYGIVGPQGFNVSSLTIISNPSVGTATTLNGAVYYVSPADFVGVVSFMVAACDNSRPVALCANATVIINVQTRSPGPVTPDFTFTIERDRCATFNIFEGGLVYDPNGVPLDYASLRVISSVDTRGCAMVLPGGLIRFTPEPDFLGTTCFGYRICNTLGQCSEGKITVTVAPQTRASLQVNFLF